MKPTEKNKLHIELIIAFVLYLGLSAYLILLWILGWRRKEYKFRLHP